MIVLTSFKYADDFPGQKFSVAKWAPKGVKMESLEYLAAVGVKGKELHLKDFANPAVEYAQAYREGIIERWKWVSIWLYGLDPLRDQVLSCWCPHSKPTTEYLSVHDGGFLCHTGLIGLIIRKHRPDIDVVLDVDREEGLYKGWRPE